VKLYAVQIGLALEAIHLQNVLFRDLKSANVLIGKDGYLKISDFGLAKESLLSFSFLGSVHYIAPEMLVDS
jgi:serine/threonine protein kinase